MTACPWIIAKRLHAACVLSCVFSGCTWARLCILQVWTNSYWDRTRCRHCHTKQQRHANLRMRISLCLFVCAYITERTKKQRTDLLHKVDDFSLLLLWLRTCRNSVVLWSIWSEARTREREMSRINMRWIDKWDGSLCVRVRENPVHVLYCACRAGSDTFRLLMPLTRTTESNGELMLTTTRINATLKRTRSLCRCDNLFSTLAALQILNWDTWGTWRQRQVRYVRYHTCHIRHIVDVTRSD